MKPENQIIDMLGSTIWVKLFESIAMNGQISDFMRKQLQKNLVLGRSDVLMSSIKDTLDIEA